MAMAVIIAMATGTFTVAIANACNSGLGENRVTAIAISRDDSGEARLWVGTACGLSCYRY
ncbi:MAG: hypothetical protein KME54_25335 [Tolypothrix brevis GSE-NOS-MK-07-07A]|nr:hypothetical protein [Tolypothrix brevis GSE-NOS-MK-07-07A]